MLQNGICSVRCLKCGQESEKMDLFEKVRDLMPCEYISDIPIGANRKAARQVVASLNLYEYPLSELQDMAQYLYGGSHADLQKEEVVALLQARKTGVPWYKSA